jgi:hypothetical protein
MSWRLAEHACLRTVLACIPGRSRACTRRNRQVLLICSVPASDFSSNWDDSSPFRHREHVNESLIHSLGNFVAAHSLDPGPLFILLEGGLGCPRILKSFTCSCCRIRQLISRPLKSRMVFVERRGTAWFSAPQPSASVYFLSRESLSDPITGRLKSLTG